MGWRDDGDLEKALRDLTHGVGSNEEVFAALLAMPAPDRLALARELLPAGSVVVREVGEQPVPTGVFAGHEWSKRAGWNACRAAMMGEGE
jgi:predicted esterase